MVDDQFEKIWAFRILCVDRIREQTLVVDHPQQICQLEGDFAKRLLMAVHNDRRLLTLQESGHQGLRVQIDTADVVMAIFNIGLRSDAAG